MHLRTRPLISIALIASALTVGAGIAPSSTPAFAATKGGCKPYLQVIPVFQHIYDVKFAGSSSGWSPPGKLRITATVTIPETGQTRSVTGTKTGKSVATPVGELRVETIGISARLSVVAYGPAGKVSCRASA
jgi:hypothetical protein